MILPLVFWDTSSLVKRFAPETGSETVDALWTHPNTRMATTTLSYAETFSVLLRKFNGGRLNARAFNDAVSFLEDEVLNSSRFAILSIDDDHIFQGIPLMKVHHFNSADAAVLACCLAAKVPAEAAGSHCFLSASDKRLIRASEAEGLRVINPENLTPSDALRLLDSK